MKCHHNDFVEYIRNNLLQNYDEYINELCYANIKYYNFQYIQPELIDAKYLFFLCQKNYFDVVKLLVNRTDIDINSVKISMFSFLYSFLNYLLFSLRFQYNHFNRIFNFILFK